MSTALPLIMDALIILLLAGTIFYAARLTFYLKAFRDNKSELEGLLLRLSSQIEKAELSIHGLKENAREQGRDLQQVINEGQALSEELQIMSQSGDRLASRLENLAQGKSTDTYRKEPEVLEEILEEDVAPFVKERKTTPKNEPFSSFSIRDPEFEEPADDQMDEFGLLSGDYEDESSDEPLQSRAERELFEALRHNKKAKAGAGGIS